ncbi:MAG TPA: hypothetical protein VIM52_03585 [Stellaceae bacterium]
MSQSDSVTATNPAADTAKIIYVLYLVGWIIPVIPPIIGLIMAYIHRADAPAWVQSHYQFQIRTFWIGTLFFIIGCVVATFILNFIGWLIFVLTMVWWIIRCVKGLKELLDGAAHVNPATWVW